MEELELIAELRLNPAAPEESVLLVEQKVNEIVKTVNELIERVNGGSDTDQEV